MGFIRSMHLKNGPRDFVPADFCSNAVLATAAYIRTLPESTFLIYHSTSSVANPMEVYDWFKGSVDYLKFNPFDKQIRQPRWWAIPNKDFHNALVYFEDELPMQISEAIAKLPVIGNKQALQDIQKFKKV